MKLYQRQHNIIKAIKAYVEKKRPEIDVNKINDQGVCNALSILYLYKGSDWLHDKTDKLGQAINNTDNYKNIPLDVLENYKNDIEELLEHILVLQNPKTRDPNLHQNDADKTVKLLKSQEPVNLNKTLSLAFVLTEDELKQTLQRFVANTEPGETKLVQLGSSTHVMGLMYKDGSYHLYDPNCSKSNKIFNIENEGDRFLVYSGAEGMTMLKTDNLDHLMKQIEYSFFGAHNRPVNYMPITLDIYNTSPENHPYNKNANDEQRRDWIAHLIEQRDTDSNIDAKAWDSTTSLILAAQNGHADTVDILLKHKSNPNLSIRDNGILKNPLSWANEYRYADAFAVLAKNDIESRTSEVSKKNAAGENFVKAIKANMLTFADELMTSYNIYSADIKSALSHMKAVSPDSFNGFYEKTLAQIISRSDTNSNDKFNNIIEAYPLSLLNESSLNRLHEAAQRTPGNAEVTAKLVGAVAAQTTQATTIATESASPSNQETTQTLAFPRNIGVGFERGYLSNTSHQESETPKQPQNQPNKSQH